MQAVFAALNHAIGSGDDEFERLKLELCRITYTKDEIVRAIREAYGWNNQIKHIADLIWSFLQYNISLSEQNYKGETLLNYAIGSAGADDNHIIELLLSIPTIDVNQNDSDSGEDFPLKNAVMKDNFPIVKQLLQLGADVNNVDSSGSTVYHLLQQFSRPDIRIQTLLLSCDFDVNIQNKAQSTALMQCIQYHSENLAEKIIQLKSHQINFNLLDYQNRTVIQLALYKNRYLAHLLQTARASALGGAI